MTLAHLNTPPWVAGLRPPAVAEPHRWKEAAAAIIEDGLAGLTAGPGTLKCEGILGIASSCYWYLCQAAKSYGHAVFVWHMDQPLTASDGSLTPFDSGGLVSGKMAFDPPLTTEAEFKDFYDKNRYSLEHWAPTFTSGVKNIHGTLTDYISGLAPTNGLTGVRYDPADPQAFFWEAHVLRSAVISRTRPYRLFITENANQDLLDWLANRADDDYSKYRTVIEWVGDNAVKVSPAQSPADMVRQALARWAAAHP
ncbi:hypothetical protein [Azospirillum palustre]